MDVSLGGNEDGPEQEELWSSPLMNYRSPFDDYKDLFDDYERPSKIPVFTFDSKFTTSFNSLPSILKHHIIPLQSFVAVFIIKVIKQLLN